VGDGVLIGDHSLFYHKRGADGGDGEGTLTEGNGVRTVDVCACQNLAHVDPGLEDVYPGLGDVCRSLVDVCPDPGTDAGSAAAADDDDGQTLRESPGGGRRRSWQGTREIPFLGTRSTCTCRLFFDHSVLTSSRMHNVIHIPFHVLSTVV
jgi:hypothetical protein